jgi:L-fucose dehydrogenase
MDLGLHGKFIVVTGGAKGIGKGIAKALADEGAIPIIVGRKAQDNHEVVSELKRSNYEALSFAAELTKPEECARVTQEIMASVPAVHGLVNNAGVNDGVGLETGTYETFVASLHKNLIHYYLMAKYLLPQLKANKGAIVNIGSKTAETGQGNTSGYAASNGGRNALTREWAVELLPFKVRVNAVIVAECFTPLYETWINTFANPQEKLKSIESKIPLGHRMTTDQEIADMVVFLISQRSTHTTGQLIYVDGGYVHLDRAITN